jgi:serine O-acetyltransferase
VAVVIRSWAECREYVAADLDRYGPRRIVTLAQLPQARWQVRLRTTEWWCNTRRGAVGHVVAILLRQRLQAHGVRLGYSIPINVAGPGLRLPHWGTIAINGHARIGANCQILVDVVIGGNDRGAPVIGDSVFIGPGVKIIGAVRVGSQAVLGAGALISHDVPAGQTWIAPPGRALLRSGESVHDGVALRAG